MRISSCFVSRRVARGRLTSDSSHNRIESNSRVGLVHAGCAGAWTSTNPRKPSRLLLPNCYHLDGQAAACSRAETCRTLALLSNLSNIHSTSGGFDGQSGQVHERDARGGCTSVIQHGGSSPLPRPETRGGGTHTYISRRIRSLGLDTSHFTGKPGPGEYTPHNRHNWQTLLTERPEAPAGTRPSVEESTIRVRNFPYLRSVRDRLRVEWDATHPACRSHRREPERFSTRKRPLSVSQLP